MRKSLIRAGLAGAMLVAATFASAPAHATDACDNDPGDREVVNVGDPNAPVLRVGLDDPLTGLPGVVVVCVGLLGDPEVIQVGGGVSGGRLYICDPGCNPFP